MKKVLVLGAGLVARPPVQYLMDLPGVEVTAASRTVSKAQAIVGNHPQGRAVALSVDDDLALEAAVSQADLSISLLPYVYHPKVAALCVKHRKHMVTTSYVKDQMSALDGAAKEAGVILLNEIGVDPGIDHMSAMKVIHEVERKGGKISSFVSWCGGLPAPEASDNPLGYKFSWSPKGVLLAGKNPARFQKEGRIVEIPGEELFDHYWPVQIPGLGEFEGYPNRDSLPYADTYGIRPSGWMFRGTLRNPGWCRTLKTISAMGLLEDTPVADLPATYRGLTARLLGADARSDLQQCLADRFGLARSDKPIADLEWLGLFSEDPLPAGKNTPIDILTERMLGLMSYKPGERDMLIMQHEIVAEYADHREAITATMIDYGIPYGDSSMSRTVGLPAAVATGLILDGDMAGQTGVQTPVIPQIYEPVLARLAGMGIGLTERWEKLP
ncbi:MAG: saccharopine dehydrogenase NADP-binding domain-containing protein [Anaerolineae bacterium]|nr:saccharopine dehydrogenase NADP-binding domain-containing protein [Anaerolineae bacterium]